MVPHFSSLLHFFEGLTSRLWDILAAALVLVGVVLTIRSRFVQFRYLPEMFAVFAKGFSRKSGGINSFQALILSIAGCVGTGNIAGVAIAITVGGPGAVFWMWVAALLGMATSYFECTLAQLYKVKGLEQGVYRGGPGFYILYGLKNRYFSSIYSIFLLLTYGFSFTAFQAFAISSSFHDSFHMQPTLTGVLLSIVILGVIFGGIYRITRVAEYLVPVMACGYIGVTLFVIAMNLDKIPHILNDIVTQAFGFHSVVGGGLGVIISTGIRRGLFANEAGLGGAPNVAAIARVDHPSEQGIIQSFSVFVNTIILCTCTALLILLSGIPYQGATDGAILTQIALSHEVGSWGKAFISTALFLFAFTTIIYNGYLGENALNFLRKGGFGKLGLSIYRLCLGFVVFVACIINLETILTFVDFMMGILAFINLTAIVLLSNEGLIIMRDYDAQRRKGTQHPVLSAKQLPLHNLPKDSPWFSLEEEKS